MPSRLYWEGLAGGWTLEGLEIAMGRRGVGWKCREQWVEGLEGKNARGTHDTDASDTVLTLGSLLQHDIGFVLGQVGFGFLGC